MAELQFAPWVEPIARRYRASRVEAVRLAKTLTQDELSAPTGDTGWSVRDELAHIASDGSFVEMLETLVRGERPDTSQFADIDALNARNVERGRTRPVDAITVDLEKNGVALQELLARLTAEDEARKPAGISFTFAELLGGNSQHDDYHIGQIHQALAATAKAMK